MDLDKAYAQAENIPDGALYGPRWVARAAAFREALGARLTTVAYGAGPRELMDVMEPSAKAAAGTLVFVHGGFWRITDKSTWSHLAAGALARGWRVAMPSYTLCPDARISQITGQIAGAVTQIAARSPGPLALTGHSAGGHLVARMITGDVLADGVRARISRVMPIAPLADLRPLIETSMNADLRLDPAEAASESPVLQRPDPAVAVHVVVGADDRPVFVQQARDLARAWSVKLSVVAKRHHFDVIEALEDAESALLAELTG
ncbi:MAG: alpha/beta hydrolase [Rhodobacteraceae bacterium]|nr:alpha/beta hydrolase [Paracoccaceae bacterium]